MGQMGAGIAARLVENGANVLTSLVGRSPQSVSRAEVAGAVSASDEEIVARSSAILSIVPPARAGELSDRFLPLLKSVQRPPIFLDCNAIAPDTVREISDAFGKAGLPFGDASIIGPAPAPGRPSPRLYMSGDVSEPAESLKARGIDARVLSDIIGDASSIKMAYAGITKGFQALGTAMSIGAARNGVLEPLIDELNLSQDALFGWLVRHLPKMPDKAYRWNGEMLEIAKFLMPEQGSSGMFLGAADLFSHVADDVAGDAPSDLLEALERFTRREGKEKPRRA